MKKQQPIERTTTTEKLGLKTETLRRMVHPLTEEQLQEIVGGLAAREPVTHSQGTCP